MDQSTPTLPWWVRPAMAAMILPATAEAALVVAGLIYDPAMVIPSACLCALFAPFALAQIAAWRHAAIHWSRIMRALLFIAAALSLLCNLGNAILPNFGPDRPAWAVFTFPTIAAACCLLAARANRLWTAHWHAIQSLDAAVPHCPSCHYDLRQTPDPTAPTFPTCPECGHAAPTAPSR